MKTKLSLTLSALGFFLLVLIFQSYAAFLGFAYLVIEIPAALKACAKSKINK